ncbi:copper amine oxidase N-terminal domain-containing protein [Acetoanaerobium noterae]|uniref:copper amine oxidase N-terminal domain-containing protein n=1 Tax=Acetoanaerobium noterae TaxID=745369 RepID=UPI003242A6AB
MKRKLSLLMVLMMVLTLIPAMPSFAATANRVDRVISLTSDGDTFGASSQTNLIISTDGKQDVKSGDVFRLELDSDMRWADSSDTIPAGFIYDGTAQTSGGAAVLTPAVLAGTGTWDNAAVVVPNGTNYQQDFVTNPLTFSVNGNVVNINTNFVGDGVKTELVLFNEVLAEINSQLSGTGFSASINGTALDFTHATEVVMVESSSDTGLVNNGVAYPTTAAGQARYIINRTSDTRLEVKILAIDASSTVNIAIPLHVKMEGASEGAKKVKVVQAQSGVDGGDYIFATVGAGDVTIKSDSKVKISRTGTNLVSMVIDEVAVNSFDNSKEYTLRLPKEFSWDMAAAGTSFSGPATVAVSSTSNRDLIVTVNAANSSLQSIFINAKITPSRDAKYGDVTVNVAKGSISPSSFVVAEYVDFVGMVKVDKVLDVVSGKYDDNLYTAKVIIEEPVAGTLLQNRYIEFSFNKDNVALENNAQLKVTRKSGTATLEIDATSSKALTAVNTTTADIKTVVGTDKYDSHQWDMKVTGTGTASKFEIEIPFVVSTNYEGDVELTVKGAGIEEQKVVIAKAKKPVTVEVDKNSSADLKIGIQRQAAPDIIITETEAGALLDGKTYEIRNRYDQNIIWRDAKIEVIEGDLELDSDTDYFNTGVNIIVDSKSTKPSKIKISGVQVTLDRTVPYGPFELDYNFGLDVNKDHTNLSKRVARLPYFNVVTPAPGDQNATTTFTMDSTTFTMIINGQPQTMTMDVAPFIQDNRAMLPIKYVADAIGAKVNYDPMSRVATFTKDATVAALYLDSNVLYVNGTPVTMDTKPVISNGRAMVPVIYVAQAFGFQYGTDLVYDAATRSVTIFPAN